MKNKITVCLLSALICCALPVAAAAKTNQNLAEKISSAITQAAQEQDEGLLRKTFLAQFDRKEKELFQSRNKKNQAATKNSTKSNKDNSILSAAVAANLSAVAAVTANSDKQAGESFVSKVPPEVISKGLPYYITQTYSVGEIIDIYNSQKIPAHVEAIGKYMESYFPEKMLVELEIARGKVEHVEPPYLLPSDKTVYFNVLQTYLVMWCLLEMNKEIALQDLPE